MSIIILYFFVINTFLFMTHWSLLLLSLASRIILACNHSLLPLRVLEWVFIVVRAGFQRCFNLRHFRLRLFILTSFLQHWRLFVYRDNPLIMSITILHLVEMPICLFVTQWTFLFDLFFLGTTFRCDFLLLPLTILQWAFFVVRARFQRLFNHRHFRLWPFILLSFVQHWRLVVRKVILLIVSITILHFVKVHNFLFIT